MKIKPNEFFKNIRRAFLFIIFISVSAMVRAQTNNVKSIFSFDFNYLLTGLTNNGVGLGVKYEHTIVN
jgi:hypothetical protein